MISSGQPVKEYIDSAVRHVLLRQVCFTHPVDLFMLLFVNILNHCGGSYGCLPSLQLCPDHVLDCLPSNRVYLVSRSRSCLIGIPRESKAPKRLSLILSPSTLPRKKKNTSGLKSWQLILRSQRLNPPVITTALKLDTSAICNLEFFSTFKFWQWDLLSVLYLKTFLKFCFIPVGFCSRVNPSLSYVPCWIHFLHLCVSE